MNAKRDAAWNNKGRQCVGVLGFLARGITDADTNDIRLRIQQERALGSPRFMALVEKTLNRPVLWRKCGRPIDNSNAHDLHPL